VKLFCAVVGEKGKTFGVEADKKTFVNVLVIQSSKRMTRTTTIPW
jgi:hypothetical protein